ncbi:MAG: hypothetical protein K6B70_07140 [Clostridia bacterium]|nr:hypothetical protein [Clostridia bacterium]
MKQSSETLTQLKNEYYEKNDSDWYVLSEAMRAANQKLGENMQIDSYCANWGYESGFGRTVKFNWKSGEKYYSKELSCWNYTEGSYPTLEVDGNSLVEIKTSFVAPG